MYGQEQNNCETDPNKEIPNFTTASIVTNNTVFFLHKFEKEDHKQWYYRVFITKDVKSTNQENHNKSSLLFKVLTEQK